MKRLISFLAAAVLVAGCAAKTDMPPYLDEACDLDMRVADALSRMTLEEKVAIIHAQSKFSSAGVKRLGIPGIWTSDGPHGVRPEVLWDEWNQAGWTNDSCVAFPALTCLAATWNRDMAALYGKSIGEEALYRGKNVLLGPGVNIYRTPLGGRNFEYMGEDPFLAGEMVVPYVQNVQKNGVATCVKHFCLNNEETHRHTVDIDLDDRALYEIYLPAFKKAVMEGGSWTIMGSYNLYRGQHVCHNHRLIQEILKGEWGFDGAVISDWGGTHDTDEAVSNGLDMEFGTRTDGLSLGVANAYNEYYLADPYLAKLRSGEADIATLDDKAGRVLKLIFRTAMASKKGCGSMCSDSHYEAARRIAGEGMVLLKNEGGLLPLSGGNILVVGENAVKMMTVGGGSSSLKAQKEILPLDGIRARAASAGISVDFARGYTGSTRKVQDGLKVTDRYVESRPAEELFAEAVEAAKKSDCVIFIGGMNKDHNQDCEGGDRLALSLPYGQDELISAIAAVNPHTAVLLVSGNAVTMPWLDKVASVLQTWYLGSEAGEAVADVLFGDVNPSGRLPFTFPARLEDSPAHYQGKAFPNDGPTVYEEGIMVGYRWYEDKNIEPLFPFGFGLSYTSFEFGEATLSRKSLKSALAEVPASYNAAHARGAVEVRVPVTNTGDRAGAEVVQLYISDSESSLPRPVKELKGFEKVYLQPGETKTVSFSIDEDMLRFFDPVRHAWVSERGEFVAHIAASSADVRSSLKFKLL